MNLNFFKGNYFSSIIIKWNKLDPNICETRILDFLISFSDSTFNICSPETIWQDIELIWSTYMYISFAIIFEIGKILFAVAAYILLQSISLLQKYSRWKANPLGIYKINWLKFSLFEGKNDDKRFTDISNTGFLYTGLLYSLLFL